jgi:hypothetical protein
MIIWRSVLDSFVKLAPGAWLVKISFASVEEKVEILRKKRDLKSSQVYKFVFLRTDDTNKKIDA